MLIDVQGYCPACGEQKLHVVQGAGLVHCMHPDCPDPMAATTILMDAERDHIVKVTTDGIWTCRHPLHERLGDKLMHCEVGGYVDQLFDAMADMGETRPDIYRVSLRDGVFSVSNNFAPFTRSHPVNTDEGYSGSPAQEGSTQ